ncbi:MAG TPA: TIGR02206 family membrane protein [Anaerolineales bacterium]|nr:TIGR02206 family membrane protein [Anaerolineales bacterium]
MTDFFAASFDGPAFEYLGTTHFAALGTLIFLNLLLMALKNASSTAQDRIRWLLAVVLLGNEIVWHYWNYSVDKWTVQTMLPLHLCSLLVWTGALMLMTKSYPIYEFMYFMGIGGAIQALATPGIGSYNYPHFLFFQYFLSHGLIITSAIFMTVVKGFRPTWKSMVRVFLWMNLYAGVVYFINVVLGSNYLMINYKPETPSLLDLLPEWPVYILYMEAIGIVTMLLLYLPFAAKDLQAQYSLNRDSASRLESISK